MLGRSKRDYIISFLQFSLTLEVLRDKPALAFCRSQEVMFQSLYDFHPYQLPFSSAHWNILYACLERAGITAEKTKPWCLLPFWAKQELLCILIYKYRSCAKCLGFCFPSSLPIFCCFSAGLHTLDNCLISKVQVPAIFSLERHHSFPCELYCSGNFK